MIGVFDSGYGGLSVLKYFLKYSGDYNYIYFGDNARVPYGNKSEEIIYQYTKEAVDFLFRNNCRLVILACNTASSTALRRLQQEYLPSAYPDRRILGVVRPIVEDIVRKKKSSRIGVIGTKATIDSRVYEKEIAKLDRKKTVIGRATPLLAPLIEEDEISERMLDIALAEYLGFLDENDVDELILGCTHYPLVIDAIRKKMPKNCKLHDPGEVVAKSLADYLDRHKELGIKKKKAGTATLKFYTSDSPKIFKERGERFLGQIIMNVEKAIL